MALRLPRRAHGVFPHRMTFQLDWAKLLSDQRHGQIRKPKLAAPSAIPRTEFEKDYDRVVFSAPFRRLAGKTQVHPFATLEHVHNRLTHTFEVASVGRSLAYAIGRLIHQKGRLPEDRSIEDISSIVQAACLAHDLGNPPFGHAGEYAIRDWAKRNSSTALRGVPAAIKRDWLHFEGNAQSLRMVTSHDQGDQTYFRFTHATVGALIKYPWTSADPRAARTEKHNAFSTEAGVFDAVSTELGLRRPDGHVVRHPLSFLSEAADDICYRIGDFEDAVEMNILEEQKVRDIFDLIIGERSKSALPLSGLRATAIGRMVDAAARVFAEDYAAIMTGRREADLKSSFPAAMQDALKTIKEDYDSIFSHRAKVAVELGAPSTLGRILDTFVPSVRALAKAGVYDKKKLGFIDRRCLALGWREDYLKQHAHQSEAWWLAHLMDFVASLTDNQARQISREIAGL